MYGKNNALLGSMFRMIFIMPRFEQLNKFVKIVHCNYKVINIFYLSQFKMMNSTSGVY
jgi:hypothetical protein